MAKRSRPAFAQPDASWKERSAFIALRLARGERAVLPEAEAILAEEAAYASATGSSFDLLRSACTFANRFQGVDPRQSLAWLDLAQRFDPWNAVAWNTRAAILLQMRRLPEARLVAAEGVRRFPENPVARNGLAEVLKEAGQLHEAEVIYRETLWRYPRDIHARDGLASVLRARGDFGWTDDVRPELYEIDERPELLVAEIREPTTSYQVEPDVGSSVQPLFDPSVFPRPVDAEILLQDAYLLRLTWGAQQARTSVEASRKRARDLLFRLLDQGEHDAASAGEAGLLRLALGELIEAHEFLERAARLYPGSPRVLYAAARAAREVARRSETLGEQGKAVATEAAPHWMRLERLDERLRPVRLLGEGRLWLGIQDGAEVEGRTQDLLGGLGHWIGRMSGETSTTPAPSDTETLGETPADESGSRDERLPLATWWGRQVDGVLFGRPIRRADDLHDLALLREREQNQAAALDRLEEALVWRFAAV